MAWLIQGEVVSELDDHGFAVLKILGTNVQKLVAQWPRAQILCTSAVRLCIHISNFKLKILQFL